MRSWFLRPAAGLSLLCGRTCPPPLRLLSRQLTQDVGQPSHHTHPYLLMEGEILPGMHKSEFADRRTKLMKLVANTHTGMTNPLHLMIIPGAPMMYMSQDVPYRFHQNTDLFYLTGLQDPDCVLLLESSPSSPLPHHTSSLYVRPRNPFKEQWDGPRPGPQGALEFTGVDQTFNLEDLPQHLEEKYSTKNYSVWYYTEGSAHRFHDQLISDSLNRSPSRIKSVHSPSHLVQSLRLVKSQSELQLMRRAAEITCQGFSEAMKFTVPGVSEHQLESVFEHAVKMGGAERMSFPPVVAGGNRANCLHYITNNRILRDGELVLMDAGSQFFGYVSDVTRSWAVSGRFTAAQRDLYQLLLAVEEECVQECRPGVSLNYLNSVAVDMLAAELTALGLVSDRLSGTELYSIMNTLFPHHLGHYLGLDTHDTPLMDRSSELTPGNVVTIEPGIYLPPDYHLQGSAAAKELAGTGIRVEDDVVVTEDGPDVLTHDCPRSLEQLASLATPTS